MTMAVTDAVAPVISRAVARRRGIPRLSASGLCRRAGITCAVLIAGQGSPMGKLAPAPCDACAKIIQIRRQTFLRRLPGGRAQDKSPDITEISLGNSPVNPAAHSGPEGRRRFESVDCWDSTGCMPCPVGQRRPIIRLFTGRATRKYPQRWRV